MFYVGSLCQGHISSRVSILYSYQQDKKWNAGRNKLLLICQSLIIFVCEQMKFQCVDETLKVQKSITFGSLDGKPCGLLDKNILWVFQNTTITHKWFLCKFCMTIESMNLEERQSENPEKKSPGCTHKAKPPTNSTHIIIPKSRVYMEFAAYN